MGAFAQLGHRTEIFLFFRCETVEANAEKALIECRHGGDGCSMNGIGIDRGSLRRPPSVASPLLQEVRLALGDLQHLA